MARAAGQTMRKVDLYIYYFAVSHGNQWGSMGINGHHFFSQTVQHFFRPCEHLHPGKLGKLKEMLQTPAKAKKTGEAHGSSMFYSVLW